MALINQNGEYIRIVDTAETQIQVAIYSSQEDRELEKSSLSPEYIQRLYASKHDELYNIMYDLALENNLPTDVEDYHPLFTESDNEELKKSYYDYWELFYEENTYNDACYFRDKTKITTFPILRKYYEFTDEEILNSIPPSTIDVAPTLPTQVETIEQAYNEVKAISLFGETEDV